METMICKECGKEKPLSAFTRKYLKNGIMEYRDVCSACNCNKHRARQNEKQNRELFVLELKLWATNTQNEEVLNLIKKYNQ